MKTSNQTESQNSNSWVKSLSYSSVLPVENVSVNSGVRVWCPSIKDFLNVFKDYGVEVEPYDSNTASSTNYYTTTPTADMASFPSKNLALILRLLTVVLSVRSV